MPEIETRGDTSACKKAKALKHVFKSKIKSIIEEKWMKPSIAWPVSKDPREVSYRHNCHQQMVVK